MGFAMSPVRGQPVGLVPVLVRLRGAGAAAPLVEVGPNGEVSPGTATGGIAGATTTRAAAGDYTVTLKEKPGKFVGMTAGFGASTPAAATSRSVQYEEDAAFAGTAQTIRIFVSDAATPTAAELAATDVLTLVFWFRTHSINPS